MNGPSTSNAPPIAKTFGTKARVCSLIWVTACTSDTIRPTSNAIAKGGPLSFTTTIMASRSREPTSPSCMSRPAFLPEALRFEMSDDQIGIFIDQMFARDRGDPSHSMQVFEDCTGWPVPSLMHRETGHPGLGRTSGLADALRRVAIEPTNRREGRSFSLNPSARLSRWLALVSALHPANPAHFAA